MGLDQSRLDGEGMKIVLYLFKRQPTSSINWENGFVRCYKLCPDCKPAVEYQFSEFWCLSENRLMYSMCVCMCVCVEQAFWHRLRPVGKADSISGGLALAEQMVCMIGPFQLQGDPHTHRKTETLDWNCAYICVRVFVICVSRLVRAPLSLKAFCLDKYQAVVYFTNQQSAPAYLINTICCLPVWRLHSWCSNGGN